MEDARRHTEENERPIETPTGTANVINDDQGDVSENGAGGEDFVALDAYRRYEERGREDGHDLEDWLEAEREHANRNTE
jgi:hypothetical protein